MSAACLCFASGCLNADPGLSRKTSGGPPHPQLPFASVMRCGIMPNKQPQVETGAAAAHFEWVRNQFQESKPAG